MSSTPTETPTPTHSLEPGRTVQVQTPATSANLGPGFDAYGLALGWRDTTRVTVAPDGFSAVVTGHGSGLLATDEEHLVVSCVLAGLADLDAVAPGLDIRCHNTIPHGRGLGSSSAAIVAGLTAAWALARPDEPLDRDWALRLATGIEGHPDNVAAAVHGGLVLCWPVDPDDPAGVRAERLRLHPEVLATAFVPATPLATVTARRLLPDTVPHAVAAAQVAQAALLLLALTERPELLPAATRDRLHQGFRAPAMPASAALLDRLRAAGFAAVISGAGPTVLVLGTAADQHRLTHLQSDLGTTGFERHDLAPGPGATIEPTPDPTGGSVGR